MFLRKAFQVVTAASLLHLCISVSSFAQDPTSGPPPFGHKHVGGDVPIDERLTKRGARTVPVEDRVVTKGPLAASKEDRTTFAAFLRTPNSGLMRLIPPGKITYRPGPTAIPGGGAYYSFANVTHFLVYGSDIRLSAGSLSVGSVTGYGILTTLGDVPLENVVLTDPRAEFVASYEPASTVIQARAETLRFRETVISEGRSYQATLPAEVNSTYLVRSINYGKPLFGPNSSSPPPAGARRTDVLVAFRVVRKDADESLTIAWKLLKKYPQPKLD